VILKSTALAQELNRTDGDVLRIIPKPSIDELLRKGGSSIDLKLGRWFLLLREAKTAALEIEQDPSTKQSFVRFGETYYLHPGKFVLGATLEWVRLLYSLAGYVTGRSAWGRKGLVIEAAAGIQPGFSGCLTLEMSNMGEVPIALTPGMPIC
jgi:dCTP deaminase